MRASSRNLDRFETTFDHGGLVANAGLILAGTLISRLGLEALIDRWVRTGSALPGRKILTVVTAMMAGATHIDHVEVLRGRGVARRRDRACSAVQADGSFHGRDIPSVLHVRSHPPTRCRAVSRPGPGVAAGSGPGRHFVGDRSGLARFVRSTNTRSRAPPTATPRCSAITRCWPPGPAPARCCFLGCAKAPPGPRVGSFASLMNSLPTSNAPAPPGRRRSEPIRGSGPGN